MKVFIRWSGSHSKQVAIALRDWMPQVLHEVEPFVSSEDIYAGARWQQEIAQQLEVSQFGILCVTKENLRAPWLNFEAGALAKAIDTAYVMPLAIDVRPAEISNPLGQFQAQEMTRDGLLAVMTSINNGCQNSLNEMRFSKAFNKWWPDLEDDLGAIIPVPQPGADEDVPSDRELIEQILETVRGLSRQSVQTLTDAYAALGASSEQLHQWNSYVATRDLRKLPEGRHEVAFSDAVRAIGPHITVRFGPNQHDVMIRPPNRLDGDQQLRLDKAARDSGLNLLVIENGQSLPMGKWLRLHGELFKREESDGKS